jgi:hypothetical protein
VRPTIIPARIDSTGKPGIPPAPAVAVDVIVVVLFVEIIDVEVDTVDAVTKIVDVDTVETCVAVEVAENMPPKGANLRIVDKGLVGMPTPVKFPPKLDPTIHPFVGEIM